MYCLLATALQAAPRRIDGLRAPTIKVGSPSSMHLDQFLSLGRIFFSVSCVVPMFMVMYCVLCVDPVYVVVLTCNKCSHGHL